VDAQLQASHFYKIDQSEISSPFKVHSSWKTVVQGVFFRDRENKKRLMGIHLHGKFDVEIGQHVEMIFEPLLSIQEGELQSRFVDGSSGSLIEMEQGFIRWSPINGMSWQAGVINQKYLHAPLLISDQSFLSSLVGYLHKKESYEVQTIAQVSIPSIVHNFKRDSEIVDTPYFTSLFVYGEWIPSDRYSFRAHTTGFYFNRLPSFMADYSRFYGNTVVGSGSSTRFSYRYHGINYDVSSQVRVGRAYLIFGYNGLINAGAPWSQAFSERIYTVGDIDAGKWIKMRARLEYFYKSSDAAPAYFNTETYGYSNRNGVLAELKGFVPKWNFEMGVRYVLAKPLNTSIVNLTDNQQNSIQVFIGSRYMAI